MLTKTTSQVKHKKKIPLFFFIFYYELYAVKVLIPSYRVLNCCCHLFQELLNEGLSTCRVVEIGIYNHFSLLGLVDEDHF